MVEAAFVLVLVDLALQPAHSGFEPRDLPVVAFDVVQGDVGVGVVLEHGLELCNLEVDGDFLRELHLRDYRFVGVLAFCLLELV